MIVYCVNHEEGTWYTPTKREAVSMGRKERKAGDLYISVERLTIGRLLKGRALACALLNNQSFVEGREEIEL